MIRTNFKNLSKYSEFTECDLQLLPSVEPYLYGAEILALIKNYCSYQAKESVKIFKGFNGFPQHSNKSNTKNYIYIHANR